MLENLRDHMVFDTMLKPYPKKINEIDDISNDGDAVELRPYNLGVLCTGKLNVKAQYEVVLGENPTHDEIDCATGYCENTTVMKMHDFLIEEIFPEYLEVKADLEDLIGKLKTIDKCKQPTDGSNLIILRLIDIVNKM